VQNFEDERLRVVASFLAFCEELPEASMDALFSHRGDPWEAL
jgi:hypothetical protein